jgi:hypothetical protein
VSSPGFIFTPHIDPGVLTTGVTRIRWRLDPRRIMLNATTPPKTFRSAAGSEQVVLYFYFYLLYSCAFALCIYFLSCPVNVTCAVLYSYWPFVFRMGNMFH